MMKKLKKQTSSHEYHFSKNLFVLSRCRITEDDGFEDLLEVALTAQQRKRQKTRCVGGSWFFNVANSMTATRIYRKDPSKVTTSRNRLASDRAQVYRE
jgi:hypothetical protein